MYYRAPHTVSSQNFCSFCFLPVFLSFYLSKIVHLKIFCEIATYTSRLLSFDKFLSLIFKLFWKKKILKLLIASYGARLRGSVFKMKCRWLSREFECIETSPGFAQLLGENWNYSHKIISNSDQVRKKLSNDKCLEVYVVISRKKFNCIIFDKENDKKQSERKSWELTVCTLNCLNLKWQLAEYVD